MHRNEFIASRFPRTLFEKIKAGLHWENNHKYSKEEKKIQKSYKINSLFKLISENSSRIRYLPQFVSIDESIVPYKGKKSPIRQYLPLKPNRWGFKLWALCDKLGYLYRSTIYEGARYENGKKIVRKGLGKEVVLDLMQDNLDKGHVVITDNFYTSVALATELLENETYIVGQIKPNAKELPKEWIKDTKKELQSADKGQFDWVMKGQLALFGWHDTKVNFMLGTWPGLTKKTSFDSTIERSSNQTTETRDCPTIANVYNEYMGGVDLFDSYKAKVATQLTSHKWWIPLFYSAFDTAIVNSWINWNEYAEDNLTLHQFKEKIAESMLPEPFWWLKPKKVTPVQEEKKRKISIEKEIECHVPSVVKGKRGFGSKKNLCYM